MRGWSRWVAREIVIRPATDYVREFVANVNPLNVLTAYNVMRDVRDLEPTGEAGWAWLDRRRTTCARVDRAGALIETVSEGRPATLVGCAEAGRTDTAADIVFTHTGDADARDHPRNAPRPRGRSPCSATTAASSARSAFVTYSKRSFVDPRMTHRRHGLHSQIKGFCPGDDLRRSLAIVSY